MKTNLKTEKMGWRRNMNLFQVAWSGPNLAPGSGYPNSMVRLRTVDIL